MHPCVGGVHGVEGEAVEADSPREAVALLALGVAVVVALAGALELTIEEQIPIAIVGNDVVHDGRCGRAALGPAALAQGLARELLGP